MNELALKLTIERHVSRLRELAKEAEDFAARLQTYASELDDKYREFRVKTTILDIPTVSDTNTFDDDIPF